MTDWRRCSRCNALRESTMSAYGDDGEPVCTDCAGTYELSMWEEYLDAPIEELDYDDDGPYIDDE